MKELRLPELTLTLLNDGLRLETGRVSKWRDLQHVTIDCINGQYTLVYDDIYIDLDHVEVSEVAEFLNKPINIKKE